MTESEARKIKDPSKIPWNEGCFVFAEGRYYLGMYYHEMPTGGDFPHGGNLVIQCWRFKDTPQDWVLTGRFRYYADKSGKVWDSNDKKSWHCWRASLNEELLEVMLYKALNEISGLAGLAACAPPPKVNSLIFKSDSKKALEILFREKPFWMHMKHSSEPC